MNYGYLCDAAVTSAYAYGENLLPSLRAAIAAEYPDLLPSNRQASVVAVDLRSATAFTVSFGLGIKNLQAILLPSGEYGIQFAGSISQIVFGGNSNVTLTLCRLEWFPDTINYNKVEIATTPNSGVTLTLEDQYGNKYPASSDGSYDLMAGYYIVFGSATNYDTNSVPFYANCDTKVDIELSATEFTVTFAVTPDDADATIVVLDADSNEIAPVSAGVYSLPNSTVAGNYSYTVSADGYTDGTGTLTVTADATETVVLVPVTP